jgi:hypothetical protein
MFVSIGAGALVGALAQFLDVSLLNAVIACVLTTGFVEIGRALRYVEPDRKAQRAVIALPLRRSLVRAGLSAAVIALMTSLRLPRIEARRVERKLENASDNPTSPQGVQDAKQALAGAMAAGIRIAPAVVEDVGKKFAEAGKENPEAWSVAIACANYQSFWVPNPHSLGNANPCDTASYYAFRTAIGYKQPRIDNYGKAPLAEAAQLYEIDRGNPNKGHECGDAYIILTGGGIQLDGMYIKNATIRDAYVWYDAGTLALENVTFANCRLDVFNGPVGFRFLNLVLTSRQTLTFTLP